MRITKELFNSLSKKNKEELSTRVKEESDKIKIFPFTITTVWLMVKVAVLAMIILPLWKIAFGTDVFISLLLMFIRFFKLFPIFIAMSIFVDFIIMFIHIIKIDNIKREYFKQEIKVRIK